MNTKIHLQNVKRELKKRLNGYRKIHTNNKKTLNFINNISPNDINVEHCESKHFICSNKKPYALDADKAKSASIIPENFNKQWDNMISECERRINLQQIVIKLLDDVININGYEMILWYTGSIAWSKELPNSIIVEKRDANGEPTCIKICYENIAMASKDKLLCNCYVLTKYKSKKTEVNSTGRLMWNMWGEYNENMYAFFKNSIQHKFAEVYSDRTIAERTSELDKYIYTIFNGPCCDSGSGKGSLHVKATIKNRKKIFLKN
jgi:hypothetical protein